MNDRYVQGFIQKCAEAGVDPEELVKRANLIASLMRSAADKPSGYLAAILSAMSKAGRGIGKFEAQAVDDLLVPLHTKGRLPGFMSNWLETYKPMAQRPGGRFGRYYTDNADDVIEEMAIRHALRYGGAGAGATGLAGLRSALSGKIPQPAQDIELEGYDYE